MKTIVIKNPAGDVQVSKRYSHSLENPGTIIELGNFEPGILNFMKSDYIRSDSPIDIELGISENHVQNVIEKTTMFFLKNIFQGAEIELYGGISSEIDFGIEGVIGYCYSDNTIHITAYNLGLMNDPETSLYKVVFAFLPIYNIAYQIKITNNLKLQFIQKSWLEYYHEESIVNLNVGDMKIINDKLYVIVPEDEEDILSLIQKKEFLQKFYDLVDFCEKF